MTHNYSLYNPLAISILHQGKLAVLPTDTIYGIATYAFSSKGVENIFAIKHRPLDKPFAMLIADFSYLDRFNLLPSELEKSKKYWPGPYTLIFTCNDPKWQYLHRGTGGISFRIPAEPKFMEFLRQTGPLAATSANISSLPPITDINILKQTFGENVDIYMSPNPAASMKPSTVIDLRDNKTTIVRK
jgi:L-threonylcarbamoyladenylate synthase